MPGEKYFFSKNKTKFEIDQEEWIIFFKKKK